MKKYTTYQQIKEDYPYSKDNPTQSYDIFSNYVMNTISIEKRREIREDWNKTDGSIEWQDYLLQRVNKIKNR